MVKWRYALKEQGERQREERIMKNVNEERIQTNISIHYKVPLA